jgi:hypothetical protein
VETAAIRVYRVRQKYPESQISPHSQPKPCELTEPIEADCAA